MLQGRSFGNCPLTGVLNPKRYGCLTRKGKVYTVPSSLLSSSEIGPLRSPIRGQPPRWRVPSQGQSPSCQGRNNSLDSSAIPEVTDGLSSGFCPSIQLSFSHTFLDPGIVVTRSVLSTDHHRLGLPSSTRGCDRCRVQSVALSTRPWSGR